MCYALQPPVWDLEPQPLSCSSVMGIHLCREIHVCIYGIALVYAYINGTSAGVYVHV